MEFDAMETATSAHGVCLEKYLEDDKKDFALRDFCEQYFSEQIVEDCLEKGQLSYYVPPILEKMGFTRYLLLEGNYQPTAWSDKHMVPAAWKYTDSEGKEETVNDNLAFYGGDKASKTPKFTERTGIKFRGSLYRRVREGENTWYGMTNKVLNKQTDTLKKVKCGLVLHVWGTPGKKNFACLAAEIPLGKCAWNDFDPIADKINNVSSQLAKRVLDVVKTGIEDAAE